MSQFIVHARTTPNVAEYLKQLDWLINETFVPAIIDKEYITDTMKEVFALKGVGGGSQGSNYGK